MKKAFSLVLVLTLCLSLLAACSKPAASAPAAPAAAPSAPSAPAATPPPASKPAFAKLDLSSGIVHAVDHVFSKAMTTYGQRVSAATGGAVTITNYPANQLGEERDIVNGLSEGSIHLSIVSNGEMSKRVKAFSICDAPYAFKDADHMKKVFDSNIFQPYYDTLLKEFSIRKISSDFLLGSRHLTTSKKKVSSPSDLKGMKIRVPDQPPSVNAWKILGANPTPVPYGELYLALQQGVAEGQENSFGQILGAKLQEVQKYIMLTGHVVQNNTLSISEVSYKTMSPELQKIIMTEGKKIGSEVFEQVKDLEKNVQLKELQKAGMEVVEVDKAAFIKVGAEGVPTNGFFDKELYAKIQAFN